MFIFTHWWQIAILQILLPQSFYTHQSTLLPRLPWAIPTPFPPQHPSPLLLPLRWTNLLFRNLSPSTRRIFQPYANRMAFYLSPPIPPKVRPLLYCWLHGYQHHSHNGARCKIMEHDPKYTAAQKASTDPLKSPRKNTNVKN